MEATYQISGVRIRVESPVDFAPNAINPMAPFQTDADSPDFRMTLQIVSQLEPPQGTLLFQGSGQQIYSLPQGDCRYLGTVENGWEHGHTQVVFHADHLQVRILETMVPNGLIPRLVLNALGIERLIIRQGGFLLHASYILYRGKAILFTASSGTGKSTQAELWCRHRGAELINGDRVAVKVSGDGVYACGVPFSGSSKVCRNVTAPLSAIVYLSQAPKTTISPLRGYRAFRSIWEGCSISVWDRQDVDLCTHSVSAAVCAVPVFHLACTPDESAVIALESALEQWR